MSVQLNGVAGEELSLATNAPPSTHMSLPGVADEELSLATNAPPSTHMSIPDSPRSSAPETSTRLSTAHSMADEDDDISGPQAAPASTSSSLTQGNLEVIAASAARTQPPSASVSSQAGSFSTVAQQDKDGRSLPSPGKPKPKVVPSVHSVTHHPLQSPAQLPSEGQAVAVDAPQASPQKLPPEAQQAGASDAPDQDADLLDAAQQPAASTSAADAAFAAWISAAEHKEWAVVEYLAGKALPSLIKALRMVAPHTETEALRFAICRQLACT